MVPPIHLGAWSMALMLWLPFELLSGDTGSVDYFWHPQPVNKNSNSTVQESQKSAVS